MEPESLDQRYMIRSSDVLLAWLLCRLSSLLYVTSMALVCHSVGYLSLCFYSTYNCHSMWPLNFFLSFMLCIVASSRVPSHLTMSLLLHGFLNFENIEVGACSSSLLFQAPNMKLKMSLLMPSCLSQSANALSWFRVYCGLFILVIIITVPYREPSSWFFGVVQNR